MWYCVAMQKISAGLLVAAVVALGAWAVVKGPGQAPAAEDRAGTIYANEEFGYSFAYPQGWLAEPEGAMEDLINQIPSMVSVYEPASTSPMRFSVTINRNERTIKNEAPGNEEVVVGGMAAKAYLFPDGYECAPTPEDPDCSFFLIPIFRNGVWYELTGANKASTTEAYKDILASFRFTP